MNNSPPPHQPPNITNELAKERNRAAAERTIMAWIRTSLSLISFGFGIDRIVTAIYSALGETVNPIRLSRILGLSFIALGTFAILVAAMQHHHELRRLQREDYLYTPRTSLGFLVAIALVLIGLFAFLGIIIRAFNE